MDLYFDLQLFVTNDVKADRISLGGASISGGVVTLGDLTISVTSTTPGHASNMSQLGSGSWVAFKTSKTATGATNGLTSISDKGAFGFMAGAAGTTSTAVPTSAITSMFVNKGTYAFNQGNKITGVVVKKGATFNLNDFENGLNLTLADNAAHSFKFGNTATNNLVIDSKSVSVTSGIAIGTSKGTFSLTSASFMDDFTIKANKNDVVTLVAGAAGLKTNLAFKGDGNASVYLSGMTGNVTVSSVESMKAFNYNTGDAKGSSHAFGSVKSSAVSITGGAKADTITAAMIGAGSTLSMNTGADKDDVTLTSIASGVSAAVSLGAGDDTINLGSVASDAKVTIDGGADSDTITVDSVGADGALNVKADAGDDKITISSLSSSAKVTIDGGAGDNKVTLSGVGTETLVMSSLTGAEGSKYTVTNWFESNGDVTAKGNVVSIKGGIADFTVQKVDNGTATFSWLSSASAVQATSKDASGTIGAPKLGVNIKSADGTNSALLVGGDSLQSSSNIKFDNYDYIIGVKNTATTTANQVLDLGDTNKKVVHLAHTASITDGWEETATYKDITNVKASSVGKSLIINGTSLAGSLVAGGANDSLWGGGNVATDKEDNHDTLVGSGASGSSASQAHLYTGFDEGIDIVESYKSGSTAAASDKIHFLKSASYVEARSGVFAVGEDSLNHFEIQMSDSGTGAKIFFGYGLDGDNASAAKADLSASGNDAMTYDSLTGFYFGQGEGTSIVLSDTDKDAKLNWDGGAGTFSVGAIDGRKAGADAMLVGLANYSQSIYGSTANASSIAGGLVVGDMSDTGKDILIGGGNSSKETMYYVGQTLGNDEIQNLSNTDKIVFLNTKYEDLTTDLTKVAGTDTDMTFRFGNGAKVTASTYNGTALSTMKDLTLYFDDKDATWDGKEWTVTDKQ